MLSEATEYLKDPLLVAKIQNFFGVKIIGKDDTTSSCRSTKSEDSPSEAGSNTKTPNYKIQNYTWYYLFTFGTFLGDEIFYTMFIPFLFWNIDAAVARRVVLVWATVMTTGQILKDVMRWPRPACPPAVRFQDKWSVEYGMPSTHAMIGFSIPFSIVFFTINRYIYSFPVGCVIATLWCALVCVSRIYLGMHTVLDVIVGLVLAMLLMIPLVPLVGMTDYYILATNWAHFVIIAVSITVVVYYPRGEERWTPTRGDTAMVVSVTSGVLTGAWINYKIGMFVAPLTPPPYRIIWPTHSVFWLLVLRTIFGYCGIFATKAIFKILCYKVACAVLKINYKELVKSEFRLKNRDKILVDLVYKFVTCFAIGIIIICVLPSIFWIIGIEPVTFYTAM